MAYQRLDIGALFEHIVLSVKSSAVAVSVFLFVTTAVGVAGDFSSPGWAARALQVVTAFVGVYFLLGAMLRNVGLVPQDKPDSFADYFALTFLSGLCTTLGLLLLLIPGIVLTVRWLPAVSLILAEKKGVTESLSESWRITKRHFWPLLSCLLVGYATLGLIMLSFTLLDQSAAPAYIGSVYSLSMRVAGNLAGNCLTVFTSAAGIASYWLLSAQGSDLKRIFA